MPLPASHKNAAVASADHLQSRTPAHTGTQYGQDKGYHPKRRVGPDDWNRIYNGDGVSSSGAPGGGIPLHGDLSPEQDAWMNKGRSKVSDQRGPYGGGRYS